MAQPASIANTSGEHIDTLNGADGVARLKMGIGDKALAGLTPHGAWEGLATHAEGDTFTAGDGLAVMGGVEAVAGPVHPLVVDANGFLLTKPATGGSVGDRGGTLTAGATSQEVMASNDGRRYLLIQNVDPTEAMWIYFDGAAVIGTPSLLIKAGEKFVMEGSYVTADSVDVIATTIGHPFSAFEA